MIQAISLRECFIIIPQAAEDCLIRLAKEEKRGTDSSSGRSSECLDSS